MAYWIQATSTTHQRPNHRDFYCDFRSDISKLPRQGIEGIPQNGDNLSHKPCAYGSSALVLEDSSYWVLGKETNEWKEL